MSRVWIGDWLRAWRALATSSSVDGEALATVLGLRDESIAEAAVAQPKQQPREDPETDGAESPRVNVDVDDELTEPLSSSSAASRNHDLVLEGPTQSTLPPVSLKPVGELEKQSRRLPDRPYEPLFDPTVTRQVLAAIAATKHAEGEVLLREAVEFVARRRPLDRLPRRLVSTLRAGLALVIVREDMEPFSDDVAALTKWLAHVVGNDAVSAWRLDWHGYVSIRRKRTWPPPAGMPVLYVAAESMLEGLVDHVRELASRGSPVVALVPGRPTRSNKLPKAMAIVGWDHRTRVREVVRARRMAARQ
jgi:hypothetical protein